MEDNWERIRRAHLEQKPKQLEDHICKTNAKQLGVGNNILKDDWETTGRLMEDAWRQWADRFWETNGNCGRQLEDNWETTPSKTSERQLDNNLRNLGATGRQHLENHIWENNPGDI